MTARTLTGLIVRTRSLEWAVRTKTGDKQAPATVHDADFDPGEGRTTLLAGLQADRERLTTEIREKCGKLPAPVTVGIPASWVLLRIAELPTGTPDELRSMAELQVDKFSPFPTEESAVSFEVLSEHEERCRVLLSAVRLDTVNLVADTLRAAGIKPKWVDINLLAWWELLKESGHVHQTGSQVFVFIEPGVCDIIVTTAGVPVAIRSLTGMDDLSPEDMEAEIARETAYTLSSLDLDGSGHALTSVTVWHRGEAPAGLLARFTDEFGMTVHAHPLESLPPLVEGLLRRAERRTPTLMDLAPTAWSLAEKARKTRSRMILSGLLIAGFWLGGMGILFGGIQYGKQRIASLNAELTELKVPADKIRAIRDRTMALNKYMDRSRSALECLREVSKMLPPGIELKSFNYHKNKDLEISGDADTYALVADFKKQLEDSKLFVSTELPRTQHTPRGESFKIICTLPGGEKP